MIAARHSICILITKLHLHLVELSETANINSYALYRLFYESQKIYIYISAKYYWNKEGRHLVAGYHSQEISASQCCKKAVIHCLHEYPIFHFLFQLHD